MTGDTRWVIEFLPLNWSARIACSADLEAAHRRWSEARRDWLVVNLRRPVDVESADYFEAKAMEHARDDYDGGIFR